MKVLLFFKKNLIGSVLLLLTIIFSSWLMFSTFSYSNGEIQIASKAWSDFGSHLPLIRSFSFGWNFPPQYAIFPGEASRYHFLFYAFVGFLEKIGLRLDYALNIPSTIGFFSFLTMIYIFAKSLFKSRAIGLLSVTFLIFNGSFSFLYFLQKTPIDYTFINQLVTNVTFPSFHPYGEGLVSAFWNLNIYTNQRHLAAAFAFSLLVLYIFLRPILKNGKNNGLTFSIILGLLLGFSFYFHLAAFGMTCGAIFILSLLFQKIRLPGVLILVIAGILAYPQYVYMSSSPQNFHTILNPGYLTPKPLTLFSFANYWTLNLGLHIILIPIGFILASKKVKKIFAAFFAFFIIGNLFQFSPEMAVNHKFFNYFMIFGNILSAYMIVLVWKKNNSLKPVAVILVFCLIFSGIIDLFPILNDGKVTLSDYPKNPDILWIIKNTPPEVVFLNSSYFTTPESLGGRKILFGWPYFSWGAGYDTTERDNDRKNMLGSNDKTDFCKIANKYNVRYSSLKKNQTTDDTNYPINHPFFENNFPLVYSNPNSQIMIYSLNSCYTKNEQ